jgi:hypothetical protein
LKELSDLIRTNEIMKKLLQEIPNTKLSRKGTEVDFFDMLRMIWPPFVELEGYILLGGSSSKIDDEWIIKTFGGKSAYEDYENHTHIIDLCDMTLKQTFLVALTLKDIWKLRLKELFPGKKFRIVVTYDGKRKVNTIIRMSMVRSEEIDIYDDELISSTMDTGILVEEFS